MVEEEILVDPDDDPALVDQASVALDVDAYWAGSS
jgi:hypothetical protein